MHIGVGDNKLKNKCIYFPAFDDKYSLANRNQFEVGKGFVPLPSNSDIWDQPPSQQAH
jgi:hypothetical protein